MSVTLLIRRDSTQNWVQLDPVPFQGELCLDTDLRKIKCGDGFHNYSELEYLSDQDIQQLRNEYGNETAFVLSFEMAKSTTTAG
jgi:hypothetical protein